MPVKPKPACPICRRLGHAASECPERYAQRRKRKPQAQRTAEQDRRHKLRRGDWTWAERKRRAAAVAQWRALYGDWCPGWGRPAHESADLTADHIDPDDRTGPLTVLCRSCNARKGNRRGRPKS